MADLQSQDYIRRSASTMTPPAIRNHEQEVAKLIDVSRCIGACQKLMDIAGSQSCFGLELRREKAVKRVVIHLVIDDEIPDRPVLAPVRALVDVI